MPTSRAVLVGLVVMLWLGLTGCTGGSDSHDSVGSCPEPRETTKTDAVPADLLLPEFGVFTRVEQQRGYVNAVSVTDGDVDGMTRPVSDALREAGYTIIAQENEIIEADIFFARGQSVTGGVKFINGPCEGQVTVRLFVGAP